MLKKDDSNFGILLGIVVPILSFGILYLVFFLIVMISGCTPFLRQSSLALLSMAVNIILIRYYFNNLHFLKTGKALLLVTIILVIAFFVFMRQWEHFHLPGLRPY